MRAFLAAIAFMTQIPVPGQEHISEKNLVRAVAFFPLVGLIIGIILLFSGWALPFLFPVPPVNAALLLTLWVALTGAMHLDGLSDTFDGIGGGIDRQRRLRIMKDSGTGTFGMAAVFLLLLLKYSLLLGMEGQLLAAGLLLAPLLSRWSLVLLTCTTPYARENEGLGRPFIEKAGKKELAVATATAAAAGLLYSWFIFLFLLPAVVLATVGARLFFLRKLGGITGDCLGAVNELMELLVLLCIAAPLIPALGWAL